MLKYNEALYFTTLSYVSQTLNPSAVLLANEAPLT